MAPACLTSNHREQAAVLQKHVHFTSYRHAARNNHTAIFIAGRACTSHSLLASDYWKEKLCG
jgi:hypothetical protein